MILFNPPVAVCPNGFYGEGCNRTCSCRNNGICHPASGQCVCAPGWTGPKCTEGKFTHIREQSDRLHDTWCFCICVLLSLECPAGFYGADCQQHCLCQNGAPCNKTSGTCTCASGWTGAACELGKTQKVWVRVSKCSPQKPPFLSHDGACRRKIQIYFNLGLIFILLAVVYNNMVLWWENTRVAMAEANWQEEQRESIRHNVHRQ